jgi:hypothetical protein
LVFPPSSPLGGGVPGGGVPGGVPGGGVGDGDVDDVPDAEPDGAGAGDCCTVHASTSAPAANGTTSARRRRFMN